MKVSEPIINRLNSEADLVSIIRRHTVLKPAGREFKGNCPFHGEKTPSFYVNPQTNLYYCFGCGAKGNAISFLVDFEKLTFTEALKTLSLQTGIDLPKENTQNISYKRHTPTQTHNNNLPKPKNPTTLDNLGNLNRLDDPDSLNNLDNNLDNNNLDNVNDLDPNPPQVPQIVPQITLDSSHTDFEHFDPYYANATFDTALDDNADLYDLLNAVTCFYQAELKRHQSAYDYFLERGLTDETIDTFELGYAPAGWQHLMQVFAKDIEGLKILGLIRTSQKGRDFCLLKDRVIFPIKDTQGRVVGFAGRALSDDVMPKYMNSTDSVVFNKHNVLYGLYHARQMRAKQYLMVEGYMDVIALYQAGIFGAVAPMGTSANDKQIAKLLKFDDTLTLCFDGDKAGQKAAMRTLQIAMPVLTDGKRLKFLTLPNEHDPDSFVKAYGKDAMQNAINNALSLSGFLYAVMADKFDLTKPEQKAIANSEVRQIASHLPKGASFRYFLTNDFYQRLNQKIPKKSAATNYEVDVTTPMQELFLCILYHPSLATKDSITHIFNATKLHQITHTPSLKQLSPSLYELIVATQTALPHLPYPNADTPEQIDTNAHFIFSSMASNNLTNTLTLRWGLFFNQAKFYENTQLPLKYQELFCQILMDYYKNLQDKSPNLRTSQVYKRCILAIDTYFKETIKPKIEQSW